MCKIRTCTLSEGSSAYRVLVNKEDKQNGSHLISLVISHFKDFFMKFSISEVGSPLKGSNDKYRGYFNGQCQRMVGQLPKQG